MLSHCFLRCLLSGFLVFCCSAFVCADPASSVEDCLTSGSPAERYDLALRLLNYPEEDSDPYDPVLLLKAASRSGHVKATIRLGSMYLSGSRVERSAKTAFGLYRKAAMAFAVRVLVRPIVWIFLILFVVAVALKAFCCFSKAYGWVVCRKAGSGDPVALYKAALRCKHGRGMSRELSRAMDMFMRSAEDGFAPAQVELGHFYRDGIVVQQNRIKAAEWYLMAAGQGDSEGLHFAGQCYEAGAGVPMFFPKAYGFYLLAAARGNRKAGGHAAELPEKMTDSQAKQGISFAHEYAGQNGFNWFG